MNKKMFLSPAVILLPKKDFEKWAVVACDQYTSEPEYWQDVEKIAGGAPSAYNIVLPEAYLGKGDTETRIEKINNTMSEYVSSGVFEKKKNTYVYIERTDSIGKIRKGLIGLIDLEEYDYRKGSDALIRATEETVIERIPPRVKIRKDAILEMPHIMLLIDDPDNTVIEPFSEKKERLEKVYDFDLMKKSGHIVGFSVPQEYSDEINKNLNGLLEKSGGDMLFAVGDGNHSLATAKECYKLNNDEKSRYALVEVVNIHDSSLEFEPIYRVVFGVQPKALIDGFIKECGGEYNGEDAQKYICLYGDENKEISVKPTSKLAVGTLQGYLDKYLKENTSASIDYIHGEQVVESLSKKENTVGFIFEGMKKSELFTAVIKDGSLPRKTFSMGHAADKRFYIEARKIREV